METRKVLVNSRYVERIIKPCKRCGAEFSVQPSKVGRIRHCAECAKLIRKPPGMIVCQCCGKQTQVKGHLVGVQKFCSPECKWNAATADPSQSWRYKHPRPCLECGKVFPARRQDRSLYCGVPCWNASQARQEGKTLREGGYHHREFHCAQCGIFCRKKRRGTNEARFCSYACRARYFSGERHYLWKEVKHRDKRGPGWDALAESIRQRDAYRCQRCGAKQKEGRSLDVHHIEPFCVALNNHPDNLITLCPTCHKTVEWAPWRLLLENPTPPVPRQPKKTTPA